MILLQAFSDHVTSVKIVIKTDGEIKKFDIVQNFQFENCRISSVKW